MIRCILFDWGDTLMRVFPEYSGPMVKWPMVEAMPYAVETLAALHPYYTLAVATNAKDSEETEIWAALGRVALAEHLDRVYCFKRIGFAKPSARFFEYIMNDLSLSAQEVIMVGDDWEADIIGANLAGLRAVWLNAHSNQKRSDVRHQIIGNLSELPAVLRQYVHMEM